tara:strand:+ start:6473 stop:8038 length:1566 start_codon:yes stop_codon:yes gene_type:complete
MPHQDGQPHSAAEGLLETATGGAITPEVAASLVNAQNELGLNPEDQPFIYDGTTPTYVIEGTDPFEGLDASGILEMVVNTLHREMVYGPSATTLGGDAFDSVQGELDWEAFLDSVPKLRTYIDEHLDPSEIAANAEESATQTQGERTRKRAEEAQRALEDFPTRDKSDGVDPYDPDDPYPDFGPQFNAGPPSLVPPSIEDLAAESAPARKAREEADKREQEAAHSLLTQILSQTEADPNTPVDDNGAPDFGESSSDELPVLIQKILGALEKRDGAYGKKRFAFPDSSEMTLDQLHENYDPYVLNMLNTREGVGTEILETVQGLTDRFKTLDVYALKQLQEDMFVGGFYGPNVPLDQINFGIRDFTTIAAYEKLVERTVFYSEGDSSKLTIDQILEEARAFHAERGVDLDPSNDPQPPVVVDYTNPGDVARLANSRAQDLLGRAASPDEQRLILSMMKNDEYQQATAQAKALRTQESVSVQTASAGGIADQQFRGTQEAADYSLNKTMSNFRNLLDGKGVSG